MRKIISTLCIIIVILTLSGASVVNAVEDNSMMDVKITIVWIDYENHLQERPDEFELIFMDNGNENTIVNVKASDCTFVRKTNSGYEYYSTTIQLPRVNENKNYTNFFLSGVGTKGLGAYEVRECEGLASGEFGAGSGTVVLFANLNKTYNFTVNWDDDNNRDLVRHESAITMKDNQGNQYLVNLFPTGDEKESDNTWHCQEFLPTYLYDENDVPIWNTPIEYTGTFEQTSGGEYVNQFYTYEILQDGTNVTINLKHKPAKVDYSIPVKVNWGDIENIPEKLNITAYSNDTTYMKAEITEDGNWEYNFENLYKFDGKNSTIAEYTILVDDIKGYAFEVTGNQEDGFEIIATEKEEIIEPIPEDKNPEEEPKNEEEKKEPEGITPPNTGIDFENIKTINVLKYIVVAIIIGIMATIIIKKKK